MADAIDKMRDLPAAGMIDKTLPHAGWKPIETAPINRQPVLIYCPCDFDGEEEIMAVAFFDPADPQPWRVEDGRNCPPLWGIPTHWADLPSYPRT